MVKIDEEAMVRPELLLVLVNDSWGPVGNAMDVGGLIHSLKLAVAIHHAARFKRRALRHSITRFGPFGPAGRAEPELLPEAVPVALETGGLCTLVSRVKCNTSE